MLTGHNVLPVKMKGNYIHSGKKKKDREPEEYKPFLSAATDPTHSVIKWWNIKIILVAGYFSVEQ